MAQKRVLQRTAHEGGLQGADNAALPFKYVVTSSAFIHIIALASVCTHCIVIEIDCIAMADFPQLSSQA